ncbi:MAG: nucleotidyltransferase family protein [Armatimonadota bacterium]|nr:nucleotidyltransferase family protein [Armatimonadota bacterium]
MSHSSLVDTERQASALTRSEQSGMISSGALPADLLSYEKLLDLDPRWALSEGSRHFEGDSAVFNALHNIAQRLEELSIPYAVIGGMALFHHGFRRFTEDVDILVTKDNLKIIHERLEGLGYLPPFANSKHLRDTTFGVKIEFLTTGEYPGDGKRKPVSFPDPKTVSFDADGVRYINLEKLVELKLASGMTNAGRLRDLSDVMQLIKALDLAIDFAGQLDPYVRDKYRELWTDARTRYVARWSPKQLTSRAKSMEEAISMLRAAADELEKMYRNGVTLDDDGEIGDNNALLVTTDARIAEKYGLVDESEIWNRDEDDAGGEPDNEGMETPHPT